MEEGVDKALLLLGAILKPPSASAPSPPPPHDTDIGAPVKG